MLLLQDGLIREIREADQVLQLCNTSPGCFAYTLANCTVGVYTNGHRAWRVKSKNNVNAVCAASLSSDGSVQLISGWANGKVSCTYPL